LAACGGRPLPAAFFIKPAAWRRFSTRQTELMKHVVSHCMTNFLLQYNFLTLSLLFALPGMLIWAVRPDMRRAIFSMIPFSLPFACTEFLFYPGYWEPAFLLDLGRRIGFGIEDIIFVSGLAAFATTAYACACNRTYAPFSATTVLSSGLRALWLFGITGGLLLAMLGGGIPVIYGACLAMAAAAFAMLWLRPDLTTPALLGGSISAAAYFMLCLAAEALIPGLFRNIWHAEKFLNIFIAGVPLEELLYGYSSGLVATAFYPYVFSRRFIRRTANEAL
jgi:hypothetical protein